MIFFYSGFLPEEDKHSVVVAGAKPWGNNEKYVGVACFASSEQEAIEQKKYNISIFDYEKTDFYLDIFQLENQNIIPIAHSSKPLTAVGLNHSRDEVNATSFNKLDLAPYRIREDEMAIGIRVGFQGGYSGGGAYTEHLQLYQVEGSSIKLIFNELIYEFEDLAGGWNKDGSRQHHIAELKYTLHVLKSKTNGFYDLQMPNGKERKTFYWSSTFKKYTDTKNSELEKEL